MMNDQASTLKALSTTQTTSPSEISRFGLKRVTRRTDAKSARDAVMNLESTDGLTEPVANMYLPDN